MDAWSTCLGQRLHWHVPFLPIAPIPTPGEVFAASTLRGFQLLQLLYEFDRGPRNRQRLPLNGEIRSIFILCILSRLVKMPVLSNGYISFQPIRLFSNSFYSFSDEASTTRWFFSRADYRGKKEKVNDASDVSADASPCRSDHGTTTCLLRRIRESRRCPPIHMRPFRILS